MFNKLISVKKFSPQTISLEELVDIVKSNPQIDIINRIRSCEYKSQEYNNLKLRLNCINPHGTFNGLRNDDLISYSRYLYYDIDGFDTLIELNDTIQKLNDTFPISFLCRSVGGKGISFLIKIDDTLSIPNDTFFNHIYNYVRELLVCGGFKIDKCANGLVRKMIISSDDKVIYNNKVSFGMDKVSIDNWINDLKEVKIIRKKKVEGNITPNDTIHNLIELKELLSQINLETSYTKEIDGDFVIEKMNSYKILLPRIIKDGTKHKLYARIINALYFINPSISTDQVFSYLYYANLTASPKMNTNRLKQYVMIICNRIQETGEIRIKPRIKLLHFNKNSNLTKKQKQNMGRKLSGKIRTNKTLKLIYEARMNCAKQNIEPTQVRVVSMTGLSIATVKRNWNKEYQDLNDIVVEIDIIPEKELDVIPEGKFFNDEIKPLEDAGDDFYELMKTYKPNKKSSTTDDLDGNFGKENGISIEGIVETIRFDNGKKTCF